MAEHRASPKDDGAEPEGSVAASRQDRTPEDDARDAPVGAIAVTTFLAVTILAFWFGMYFLNIARSS